MEIETLSFEEAYAQLEAAVNALRDGQMPLERALHYYEEGMKLHSTAMNCCKRRNYVCGNSVLMKRVC